MNSSLRHALFPLFVIALAVAPAARAQIVVGGDITTTSGLGTLAIANDLRFTIQNDGMVSILVFDNWVTNPDDNLNGATLRAPTTTISYRLNGVLHETTGTNILFDQPGFASADLTLRDGMLVIGGGFNVISGDTLTFLAGNWDLFGSTGFNAEAVGTFTGNVFLADGNSFAISNTISAVPEPSTYAALFGAAALALALYRKRRAA